MQAPRVGELRRTFKLFAKGGGTGLSKLQFSRMCRGCGLVLGTTPKVNSASAAREARPSSDELATSLEKIAASSDELEASSEELALARIARAARPSSEQVVASSPELTQMLQSEVDLLFWGCSNRRAAEFSVRAVEYADQKLEAEMRAEIQAELPALADNVYARLLEEYALGSAVSTRWSLRDKTSAPAEEEQKRFKEPVRHDYTDPDWEGPLDAEIECDLERVARIEKRRATLAMRQHAEGKRDSPIPKRLKKRPIEAGRTAMPGYGFAQSSIEEAVLLCGRGAAYIGVSRQAEGVGTTEFNSSQSLDAEHVAQRRFEAERAAFLIAGARRAPPGMDEGGRELMTLSEFISALARLAWQVFPHLGGIDRRLSALLEEALLPAAKTETLAITASHDAYDVADVVRVGAIFEHFRKDLQRIFDSYAAADMLSVKARGAQNSMNLGELTYFAKDGELFDDRLTVSKLSSIFVKVNAGDDGAGDDGAADEDEQELTYKEWLEVLARICCLKVGAAPGMGTQAWSKVHRYSRSLAASRWGCLGAGCEPTFSEAHNCTPAGARPSSYLLLLATQESPSSSACRHGSACCFCQRTRAYSSRKPRGC